MAVPWPTANSTASRVRQGPRRSSPGVLRRTQPSPRSAVELRVREIRRSLAKNFVGPLKVTDLPFLLLEPFPLRGRQPRTLAAISLRLPNPAPLRLGRAAHRSGNRFDRRPLRCVIAFLLEYQPYRPLSNFLWVPLPLFHVPIPSRCRASAKPGAVHSDGVEASTSAGSPILLDEECGRELDGARSASRPETSRGREATGWCVAGSSSVFSLRNRSSERSRAIATCRAAALRSTTVDASTKAA